MLKATKKGIWQYFRLTQQADSAIFQIKQSGKQKEISRANAMVQTNLHFVLDSESCKKQDATKD